MIKNTFNLIIALSFAWGVFIEGRVMAADTGEKPIIIAHRGASGLFPEHTLEGYKKAIEQGADFIEPDLVITKDGVLVARHDIYLSTTTNVASLSEFADKKRFVPQLGRSDWLVVDFTLAEIKKLRAVQAREGRDKSYDGLFEVPTFAEIVNLAKSHNQAHSANVGVYPETKKPQFYQDMGYNFGQLLLDELKALSVESGQMPLFIQSFDVDILNEIAPHTSLALILLLESQEQDQAIKQIKKHKDILTGIGPDKRMLMQKQGQPSQLMQAALELGLKVHPWTFRDDDVGAGFANGEEESLAYLNLGINGMFTDFTNTGVKVIEQFLKQNKGGK